MVQWSYRIVQPIKTIVFFYMSGYTGSAKTHLAVKDGQIHSNRPG